jgi:FMN phosphatase YigB (HAD superfamily)
MSIRPNPAITSSIKAVAARVPVALVTNSTAKLARECLASLGLRDGDFTAFIAADAGFAPKPSSAPFLEVARLVDCDPGTLFGIGDRWTTDVAPLVRLGGRGVCISNPTDVVGVCADIAEFLRSDKPPLPLSRE